MVSYISPNDKIYETISSSIRKTYPNAYIIGVNGIIDKHREELFQSNYEKECKDKKNVKIINLFHGTSENSLDSIMENGFIKNKNVISAYGVGTYFSNSALVASQYANSRASETQKKSHDIIYMFISEVIISDMIVFQKGLGEINPEPSCYVNSSHDPLIYCIPRNGFAIPKYLVSYKS
jgi:hypothetical protein